MNHYDVIIAGGGLGGLSCGVLLAKEGLKVCVVERHSVIGGCLQSFRRGDYTFDTGVHYVGSLDNGQIMRQLLHYYGIDDKVSLSRLDDDAFETVIIGNNVYKLALGKERFINSLSAYFPQEEEGIRRFVNLVMEVKDSISVDILSSGHININEYQRYMSTSANDVICSHVTNPVLRGILAGSSLLYGGEENTSTFYVYAMVVGSNIEGAHKFLGGSQSIADAMTDVIRQHGGSIIIGNGIRRLAIDNGSVSFAQLDNGETLTARTYISTLHPTTTFDLLDKAPPIKKAYRTRLHELQNTYGVFTVYIGLKEGYKRYDNTNIFMHHSDNTWSSEEKVLRGEWSMMTCEQPSDDMQWTKTIVMHIPIYKSQIEQWDNTHIMQRGEEYSRWKESLTEACLRRYEEHYKSFREGIVTICTSSPLTYRDYTGTPNGTAYGIMKNCNNPLPTTFSVKTKLPNLLLSGQSIYVHGVIGVTMTALVTCAELLGNEYLTKRITSNKTH